MLRCLLWKKHLAPSSLRERSTSPFVPKLYGYFEGSCLPYANRVKTHLVSSSHQILQVNRMIRVRLFAIIHTNPSRHPDR